MARRLNEDTIRVIDEGVRAGASSKEIRKSVLDGPLRKDVLRVKVGLAAIGLCFEVFQSIVWE